MTTQQIGYFIRLAEELNYARVAREFFITQPTLSRQIINLENELKLVLFHRDRNSVALTREGQFFYEKMRPVFQNMMDVIDEARNIEAVQGQVTIGIQDDQLMSNSLNLAISRLRYEHPDINVAIHKADPDELTGKVATGEFDLANLAMIPTIRQNSPYTFILMESESIYLIYSADIPDMGPSITKQELYGFLESNRLIMPILHRSANDEQCRRYFALNMPSLDPDRVIHRISQSGRAISLPVQISSHLGVSLSSCSTVYSIDPRLRIARIEGTEGTYNKGVIYQDNSKNPAVLELVGMIRSIMSDMESANSQERGLKELYDSR